MLETTDLNCPYCGEAYETAVDMSAGEQAYVEDCPVCCRPIEIRVEVDVDGRLLAVRALHQDA